MTRARAPGKIVLSGAYSVLHGAPALVAAVDRYVTADTARAAAFVTPEVAVALRGRAAPSFDAEELREGGRKLGLGSSAAIVVASLAAVELERNPTLDDERLAVAVFSRALVAHREAQGGGSGVDVAASAHGGVISARRRPDGELELDHVTLPEELHIEVWASPSSASTASFLARIAELGARDPALFARCMAAQAEVALAAHDAVLSSQARDFVEAVACQVRTLHDLGEAAQVPIVTAEHGELARLAEEERAAFLPAGAGGGDVAYRVGVRPATPAFDARAHALGLSVLGVRLGGRGVHAVRGYVKPPTS